MLFQIYAFLLEVASGILAGACLLRAYMQMQYVPLSNPLGRFVAALTDWAVLPLRGVLPKAGRWDLASLVVAYGAKLAQMILLILWIRRGLLALPLLALFSVLQLALTGLSVLIVVHVVMGWLRTQSPLEPMLERLCSPILGPLRRVIPPVGGVDLSPLVALVILQVLGIVMGSIQSALMR